jgi:hypothetical protein
MRVPKPATIARYAFEHTNTNLPADLQELHQNICCGRDIGSVSGFFLIR